MMGFVYRWGLRIKDFGERVHCRGIQRTGIAIKDAALGMKIGGAHERETEFADEDNRGGQIAWQKSYIRNVKQRSCHCYEYI